MRMCNEERASATIYLKTRNNESDLIGRIMGSNGRYKPQIILEQNLNQFYKSFKAQQMKRIMNKMIEYGNN